MNRLSVGLAFALVAASFGGGSARAQVGPPQRLTSFDSFEISDLPRPAFAPGEVLVQWREGITSPQKRAVVATTGASVGRQLGRFGVTVARLPKGLSVRAAVARYNDNPHVESAEPNYYRYPAAVPNDPSFADQWYLNNTGQDHTIPADDIQTDGSYSGTIDADIDAVEAWDTQQGNANTVIAVLDSGVDVTHSDLDGSLWTNSGEIAGNGVDDDGNGYTDDVNGWDFAGSTPDGDNTLLEPNPAYFGWEHGTHVAGIIAAEMNNATGVTGVCPSCKVMVLKFFKPVDTNGDRVKDTMAGTLAGELAALDYAADNRADIVNASFGAPGVWSAAERNAFRVIGNRGVLAVVAAGNTDGDNDLFASYNFDTDGVPDSIGPNYPASFNLKNILSVAASNHDDSFGFFTGCADFRNNPGPPCAFTSWGHDSVDLAAPGVDIRSTYPGGSYATFNGTSMAAPVVTGVAGLVKSEHPGYTPVQTKNALMNSVNRPTNLRTLFAFPGRTFSGSFTRTNGRVNALGALNASTVNATPVTDGNIDGARRVYGQKKGALDWPQDANDVLKKKLRRGRDYRVVLDGPTGADLSLTVYKPGTKEIWQFEGGCFRLGGACKAIGQATPASRGRHIGVFRAKRSGTYYFHATAYVGSGGRYLFKIRRV